MYGGEEEEELKNGVDELSSFFPSGSEGSTISVKSYGLNTNEKDDAGLDIFTNQYYIDEVGEDPEAEPEVFLSEDTANFPEFGDFQNDNSFESLITTDTETDNYNHPL